MPDETFHYSLTPESDPAAWASHDPAELVELLRVPDEILDALTTAELVDAVLDYPFLGNYLAQSTPEQGLDTLCSESDALAALLVREDAAAEIGLALDEADDMSDGLTTVQVQVLEGVLASLGSR
ncbi:hypothetical protein ACFRCR_18085 [Oerskovia sp. NPDC056781]|uniref:hypothetical protein n=1 Tax=Oerskovia sp. NPDC056781 TaxID=3345942 RepID=UPI00366BAD80